MSNIEYELNEKIHAIIINPYLNWESLNGNCDLIKKYNIRNVSTSLNFIGYLKNALKNHTVNINALISYPFADLPISFVEESVCFAKDKGASGIEYVPNFINLSQKKFDTFASEIERVKVSELPVTIIINKFKLEQNFFVKAIEISSELGITNFQLGDGFGPSISSSDITETIRLTSNQITIKIVGGIKTLKKVVDFLDMGVNCIGTSNYAEIFEEVKKYK